MIQKKVVSVLALGFLMGLGLASCATPNNPRKVASDNRTRFTSGKSDAAQPERECYVGEERNENGECVRVQDIARPARRGGR